MFTGLLALILLSGCAPDRSFGEVLFNSTCEYPCWQKLEPGISLDQDFQTWFSENTDVDKDSLSALTNRKLFDPIYVFHYKNYKVGSNIFFKDHLLYATWFSGNLDISLGKLFEKIGEPDSVVIVHAMRGGDVLVDEVNLIFQKKGIIATYRNKSSKGVYVSKDLLVQQILIADPRNIEECIFTILAPGYISQIKHTWSGYGIYPLNN